jgi:hypothetical protein
VHPSSSFRIFISYRGPVASSVGRVEIEETRTALRDEVPHGMLSPQLLVRIGWAPPELLPATPRLPVTA